MKLTLSLSNLWPLINPSNAQSLTTTWAPSAIRLKPLRAYATVFCMCIEVGLENETQFPCPDAAQDQLTSLHHNIAALYEQLTCPQLPGPGPFTGYPPTVRKCAMPSTILPSSASPPNEATSQRVLSRFSKLESLDSVGSAAPLVCPRRPLQPARARCRIGNLGVDVLDRAVQDYGVSGWHLDCP